MNAAIFERNYLPSRIKVGTATDLYRLGLKFQENPQFDEYFAAVCADSLITEEYESNSFLEFIWGAELASYMVAGKIKAVKLDIGEEPSKDEDVAINKEKIENCIAFKSVFIERNPQTLHDGVIEIHDWFGEAFGFTMRQFQIEIGYCRPHQIMNHLWHANGCARWPYGHKSIMIMEPLPSFVGYHEQRAEQKPEEPFVLSN